MSSSERAYRNQTERAYRNQAERAYRNHRNQGGAGLSSEAYRNHRNLEARIEVKRRVGDFLPEKVKKEADKKAVDRFAQKPFRFVNKTEVRDKD